MKRLTQALAIACFATAGMFLTIGHVRAEPIIPSYCWQDCTGGGADFSKCSDGEVEACLETCCAQKWGCGFTDPCYNFSCSGNICSPNE